MFLIVNPEAGAKSASDRFARLLPRLIEGGRLQGFSYVSELRQVQERLANRPSSLGAAPLIVAVGGDGTVRHVAEALLALPEREGAVLGILPFGNGCAVAAELGLSDLEVALRVLRHPRYRTIDLLAVTAQHGDGSTSVYHGLGSLYLGALATLAAALGRGRGRAWWRLSKALLFSPRPEVELAYYGDVDRRRVGLLIVRCCARVSGTRLLLPARPLEDGLAVMDLWFRSSRLELLAGLDLSAAARPPLKGPDRSVTLSRVEVRAVRGRPFPWCLDGDAQPPALSLDIEIVPRRLTVAVP